MALLETHDLTAVYGHFQALYGISLTLQEGETVAIIGANGAGKTTFLKTVAGLIKARPSAVQFAGEDIGSRPASDIVKRGIALVPEGRRLFPSLSVEENLTVAARPGRWTLSVVYDLFPRIAERRRNLGNQLSGGEQQMLAIARALMTNPALLLLDEPLEGLAPIVVEELAAAIRRMTAENAGAFLLVEQHADIALSLTQAALVLERGRIVHAGPSAQLLADHATLDRYIGLKLAEA